MKRRRPFQFAVLYCCAAWTVASASAAPLASDSAAPRLEPLRYNHPGLVTDLGVGLWAWPIPGDADGDGDVDLVVSCPDKPSNGVWFFENPGVDTRSDKFPVFKPAKRLSKAVHYVTPSYVDGTIRVLSPGFEYRDFFREGLRQRSPLPVTISFYKPIGHQPRGPKVRHQQWRYVDLDQDGALDLVAGIEDWSEYGWDDAFDSSGRWTNGPLHGFVYWFRNAARTSAPVYENPVQLKAGDAPIDVYGCPSPNFADFDQDGDLDLVCGEFLDGFTWFENVGAPGKPAYNKGVRLQTRGRGPLTMNVQMIVPVAFDWDKDGDVDLVVGDEDGRVALVENTGELAGPKRGRQPVFLAPRYFEQEADALKCGALATPFGIDWDGDGDDDLLSGNTAGYFELFENLSGPNVERPRWSAPRKISVEGKPFRVMAGANGGVQGPCEAKWGYTTFSVVDWDHDGMLDIVFNSIFGKVQWLRGLGPRGSTEVAPPEPLVVDWNGPPKKPAWNWWEPKPDELVTQWRTTPVAVDWNDDKLVDLVMLDSEGYLALFERFETGGRRILKAPARVFADQTGNLLRLNAKTGGASGRRKICVCDWDGDGKKDLLVNGANAILLRGLGRSGDQWRFQEVGPLAQQSIEGHDVSPTVVDFNGDETPDFIGGAEDGRFYYLPHPRTVGK